MGVESGGAGRFKLLGGEQRFQPPPFLCPLFVAGVKDLGDSTPTGIANQNPFLLVGWLPLFVLQIFEEPDGCEVGAAFLLERAETDAVFVRDAVIVLVTKRFWLDGF